MLDEQWSESEKWVWQEIRAGRIADFNARDARQDSPLKSTISQGWGEGRRLRSEFLKQILFRQPYVAEIPAEGARIVGAWFTEAVDLSHGRLGHQLWLERCRFEGPVDLTGLQIDGWFSLEGSCITRKGKSKIALDLNGVTINGHVSFGGAKLKNVDLTGTKIVGQFAMTGATIGGKLRMDGIEVAQALRMGAKFKDVELSGKIGGELSMWKATFSGKLGMSGVVVARDVVAGRAKFKNVDLIAIKIGGDLSVTNATFDGALTIDNVHIDENLYMRGATFNEKVDVLFARCGRNLDLSDCELTKLDLSGTRIEGEFRLGSDQHLKSRWRGGASLNLRNVHIGALQDRRDRVVEQGRNRHGWRRFFRSRQHWADAWPPELQLEGFTYDRLGGFGGTPERVKDMQEDCDVDMQARDVQWYVDWLARDHSYSPQPYEQLASVFRKTGDPIKANRILYESRRRARAEARRQRSYFRWLGSYLLDWTIGYGLGGRYFRALGWVIALTVVGAGVLHFSGQPSDGLSPGLLSRIVYSLDQLLPIVEFEKYDKVVLKGGVAYYFYAQKLVGWLLGSFLVAGLAGLTQK